MELRIVQLRKQKNITQKGLAEVCLTGKNVFKVNRVYERDGIQFAQGSLFRNKEKSGKIEQTLKTHLLELMVRAKPLAAFDENAASDSGRA